MPDNFTLYEKFQIQRLMFLFIFGIFCSFQFFIEKKDESYLKKELYEKVVSNSKILKHDFNDLVEKFEGKRFDFKALRPECQKIKAQKVKERSEMHRLVHAAQGDEKKEKEMIEKYQNKLKGGAGPTEDQKKRRKRLGWCCMIGCFALYKTGVFAGIKQGIQDGVEKARKEREANMRRQ